MKSRGFLDELTQKVPDLNSNGLTIYSRAIPSFF